MIEAKHTAGPWMVEPINSGLTYQVTTSEQTGFKVICETDWGDDDDAANAQLIAAAPELHEVLLDGVQDMATAERVDWKLRALAALAKCGAPS